MRAIDTNIIVRIVTGDDLGQAVAARKAVDAGDILVPASVLLETEWVLRSGYGMSAQRIVRALRDFVGLPGVLVENDPIVARALDLAEQGLDFADAMHLASAKSCTALLTFDRKFANAAKRLVTIPVSAP